MDVFVGNLPPETNEADIKKLFAGFGNVVSAVIITGKKKKTPKSRGFGFVQMPDEKQALAAITALNSKEFMGRILSVNTARPKVEVQQRVQPRPYGGVRHAPAYPAGRRSYTGRPGPVGTQGATRPPRRRGQVNAQRWRKSTDEPKPWKKSTGEHKPWEKPERGARPWRKPEGEFKPWRKPIGDAKPWKKPAGEFKPWRKSASDTKPWHKPEGGARPWKKPAGEFKPWRQSSVPAQKSKFKGHR